MPDIIGGAFVSIQPDLSGFQQQLQAGVNQALDSLKGKSIPVPVAPLEESMVALHDEAAQQLGLAFQDSAQRLAGEVNDGLVSGFSRAAPVAESALGDAIGAAVKQSIKIGPALGEAALEGITTYAPRIGNALSDGLTRAVSGAGGLLSGALSGVVIPAVTGVANAAGLVFTGTLAAGLTAGLEAGAQLDRLRASFTALTGSATESQTIIASLRQTTIRTGQDFSQLAQSTQQLITAGFNPQLATSVLNTVSQMVTVYGRGVQGLQRASIQLEEIGFRGTVQAQQLNALIRDGVPGYQALTVAAENLGLAQKGSADATAQAKEAMKNGQITAEAFFKALSDPAVVGNVSKTLDAIQTNVAFQVNQLRTIIVHILGQIAEPVQKVFGAALRPITNQLDTLANSSDLLSGAGSRLAVVFQPLVPIFQRVGAAIGGAIASAQKGGLGALVSQVQSVLPALALLSGGLAGIGIEAARSLPLIGAFVPEAAPLLGIFAGLATVTPGLGSAVLKLAQGFAPLASAAFEVANSLGKELGPILTGLTVALGPTLQFVVQALTGALSGLSVGAQALLPVLGEALMRVIVGLDPVLQALAPAVGQLAAAASQVLIAFLPLVPALASVLVSAVQVLPPFLSLVGPLSQIAAIVAQALAPILVVLVHAITPLVPWVIALAAAIKVLAAANAVLDVVLDADPFVLILIAVAALVVGIVALIQHWDAVRAAIVRLAQTISTFIVQHRDLAIAIGLLGGPITLIIGLAALLITHWNQVTAVARLVASAIGGFFASLPGLAARAVADVGRFFSALGKTAQGVILDIGRFFSGLGSDVQSGIAAIGRFFSGLGSAAQSGIAAIGRFFSALGSRVQSGLAVIGGLFSGLGSAVQAGLAAVGGVFSRLGATIHNAVVAVTSTAEAAWAEFSRRPAYWIGFAIGLAAGTIGGLIEVILAAILRLPGAVGVAFSALGTWANQVGTSALTAGGKFKDGLGSILTALPGQVNGWLLGILVQVGLWQAQFVRAALISAARFRDALGTFLAALPGEVGGWLLGVLTQAGSWSLQFIAAAFDAAGRFRDAIGSFLSVLPGQVGGWLLGVLTQAGAWAGQFIGWAQNAGSRFLSAIGSYLSSLPGQVGGWLAGVISSAVQFVSNFANQAVTAASRFADAIRSGLAGLPGEMAQVGRDIAQGIINGIEGMIGDAKSAIGQFVQGLIDGAHAAGEGHSPYRRFAREVGAGGIAQGVILGLQQATPDAVKAMGSLVASLGGLGLAGAQGGLAASGAGGLGRGPITINVTVSNAGASGDDIARAMAWSLSQRGVTV